MQRQSVIPFFLLCLWLLAAGGCAAAPMVKADPSNKEVIEYRQIVKNEPALMAISLRQLYASERDFIVDADPRTGTLIMKGPAHVVADAVEVIDRLEATPIWRPRGVDIIRRLKSAKAANVAAVLREMADNHMFPGEVPVTCVVDERANTLFVHADDEDDSRISDWIEFLDQPPRGGRP